MIQSLFGVWKGNVFRGLTSKEVLKIPILVNETNERVVYSAPYELSWTTTHEIYADPGEAICFVSQIRNGSRVAVGPEAEICTWIRYYFYEPHLVPDTLNDLTIENCYLKVMGVTVTDAVLRSYGPDVINGLRKILKEKYQSTVKSTMVDLLLERMKKSTHTEVGGH